MKLCRDCAFFQGDCDAHDPYRFARCDNPDTASINPVSGRTEPGVCSVERAAFGRCGSEGKLFVDRQAFAEADATVGATALAG